MYLPEVLNKNYFYDTEKDLKKICRNSHLVIPTSAAETAKIRNVTFLKTNLHVDHIGEVWRNFNCQIYMTLFRLYWLSLKVSQDIITIYKLFP